MESLRTRVLLLEAMFPTIPINVIKETASTSTSTETAVSECAALLNPKASLKSLSRISQDPTGTLAEMKSIGQDVLETFGAEVYDVPNAEEYSSMIVPVVADTSASDTALFHASSASGGLCAAPSVTGAVPTAVLEEHPPVRWLPGGSTGKKHASAEGGAQKGSKAKKGEGGTEPELLKAREWNANLEVEERSGTAVKRYVDVFDTETMHCSMARELHRQYSSQPEKVSEVLPQVLPFIRKAVVGQVVIPHMNNQHVDLPLLGRIPFATEQSRIMSADIPDDGAIVNVSCDTCFRVRFRQVKFVLEPCRFTYIYGGVKRNGVLDIVVKRAHLRIGMDVKLSAYGRRSAEVYLARLRLKKFSLHARMKYSPLVNAFLSVARTYIKNVVEEELTKNLLGHHELDLF